MTNEEEYSTSMVLLLRRPHFFNKEELRRAAEKAWNKSFSGDGEDSRHFITQSAHVTFLKAGPHVLNIIHASQPYLELDEDALREFLPERKRQEAWRQHGAWVALDYLNHETDEETKYCVLAALTAEMIDENCTGVWVPKMSSFLPDGVELYTDLRTIALSKEVSLA